MPAKKLSGKAVWAVTAAVVLVVVLLAVLFVRQSAPQEEGIILPAAEPEIAPDVQDEVETQAPQEEPFVVINNENVLMALQTLNGPAAYYQSYDVTVGADDVIAAKKVSLWVMGTLIHAEVADEWQTRVLITDGTTAYLWYSGDEKYLRVTLQDGTSAEDLLGLPDFRSYLDISPDAVVDSGYLQLEDSTAQCIYVCAETENGQMIRHWVNLENGLLFQSDVLENSNQVYRIRQTGFEALALEDETFADRFLLPDGAAPFTAAARTLQP